MNKLLPILMLLSACATGSAARGGGAADDAAIEVVGHVTNTCHVAGAQPLEQVTLRAAGELDAIGTTQTDATGAFTFVVPAGDSKRKLYIEARGKKAMANQRYEASRSLVAELTLPCRG